MRRLVIDSATEACSVALFEDDVLLAGECLTLGRGHAERLVPMIADLPGKGRADRIAVNVGPGSFTGIRVGVAAARALALAWNAQIDGYDSLTLVAAMARAENPGLAVDVVMTGGHGEWFFRSFGADAAATMALVSDVPDAITARSHAPLLAGSQAEALAEARATAGAPLPRSLALRPDARAFALLSPGDLVPAPAPVYGRAPDARLPQAG